MVRTGQHEHHNLINGSNSCFILNITTTNGMWIADNPFIETLPLLVNRVVFVIFFTRSLYFILRRFHQPRIVTDILGGLLLGPSFFGMWPYFAKLFPVERVLTLETMAYMALDFYMFLIGLQMDINSIKRATKREFYIASACALIPMGVGAGMFFLTAYLLHIPGEPNGCFFWGLTLTVTGFPVVAQVLEEFKLLNTDIGRTAMSTAMISDICSWVLVVIILPIRLGPTNAASAVATTIAFTLISIYALRPFLVWIIRRTTQRNGNLYSESNLCFVLIGVVICSLITEIGGAYSIVGAFVFGIIMPDKQLGSELTERFEIFVSDIMMPLYFAICGIRINIYTITNWFVVGFIVVLASTCKILSTLLVSLFDCMPFQDSLALGVLMNTKGILAVVILNLGWDKKVLRDEDYATIVFAMVIMTGGVAPIISAIYRPSIRLPKRKRRSIQLAKQGAGLRILTCIHSVDNVSSIINLFSLSNATKESPISVFAVHLVELTGSASAMLIVHNTGKSCGLNYGRNDDSSSDQVIKALENLEKHKAAISVHPLTSLSPFITMHEDVCSLAEDKHIVFMIIPFHGLAKSFNNSINDNHNHNPGNIDNSSSSFRQVNLNILANAPCSVGIFMDKGLGRAVRSTNKKPEPYMQNVVMLFIGGPDDREALAYAWSLMLGNPWVHLSVKRLLPGKNNVNRTYDLIDDDTQHTSYVDERQFQLDTDYVNEFRLTTVSEPNVSYYEKVVNDGEETVKFIREIELQKVDLYIVGREVTSSAVTADLLDWSGCPEIGAIGDLLVFSDFIRASVLIVQQYAGSGDMATMAAASVHGSVHQNLDLT